MTDLQPYLEALGCTEKEPLGVRRRAINCLVRHGISSMEELADMPLDQIMRVRNLGEKTLAFTLEALTRFCAESGGEAVALTETQACGEP